MIKTETILPSRDGDYWIFYRDANTQCGFQLGSRGSLCSDEPQSNVFCFSSPWTSEMTARIGVKRAVTRVSWNYRPQDALAGGFVWATVAPKGHIVCVHRNEHIARRFAQTGLPNAGCTVAPIASLIAGFARNGNN